MWRTLLALVTTGFLLVSIGGNVILFRQAAQNAADADRLRARARAAEDAQAALQAQLDQLRAQGQGTGATAQPQGGSGASAPPSVPGSSVGVPSPGGPDRRLLLLIEDQVVAIRGLPKKADVPLKFLDQAALRQYFVQSFEKDYLPQERESDQKLLQTLGYVRPSENLVAILLDLLQEQVIGTYNEDEKAMYLVGDQAQFGTEEKVTFAHEFNHALQDQSFDLNLLAPKHGGNNDRSLAVHALVEGDAVLLQRLWAQDNLTQSEIQQLGQGGDTSKLDQAPLIVQAELLFPYTEGFAFVRDAYQRGGYKAVDDVFRNPPDSTEQILHPEKYRSREKPVDVRLPDLAQQLGAGWRKIDENTLGELDLRIWLQQYGDRGRATQAAAGWGGDRWQLLEQAGKQAIALRTTWDTENDAREFFDAYTSGLANRFKGAQQEAASPMRQALTATDAATDVRRNGKDVLIVVSFDRDSADSLTNAVGGF